MNTQTAQLKTSEKAAQVAEKTIASNPALNRSAGSTALKQALASKLEISHDKGDINLDNFLDKDKARAPKEGRGEGRER